MRLVLIAAGIAACSLAAVAGLERLALDQRAVERRALLQRHMELSLGALAPGSALSCLDGAAGEAIEQACEKAVFASAPSAAAAVQYTGARLALLADAARFAPDNDPPFGIAFAASRRAIELDRFGIAAHVLAIRDGCTPERCAGYALVRDSGVLKANMRNRLFEQYTARHAESWNRPAGPPVAQQPPQTSEVDTAPVAAIAEPPAMARAATGQNNLPRTVIPPVSIMDTEPQLAAVGEVATGAVAPATDAGTPLPPRRPPPAVR